MRKSLKLAVFVGGIGALVWGMRNRIRIAVRRGEESDPDFHIVEPAPQSHADEMTVGAMVADEDQDGDSDSASDDDPQASSGATDGVS